MTLITETPGVQGGYPCIAGTRIPVRSIVEARRFYPEDSTEDGLAGFYAYTDGIRLTRADVAYALAWYTAHPERVDEDIEGQRAAWEELEARSP